MPVHDWTQVSAGTFHDFHLVWIGQLRTALNDGVLPSDYYAQAEQIAGPLGPDVLTLQSTEDSETHEYELDANPSGSLSVLTVPPRAKLIAQSEMSDYVLKRRTIVIRHNSDDRIVAMIELVSPGNKASRYALRSFVEKAVEALFRGYHLLIVDLFPPSPRDPQGLHATIWNEFDESTFQLPVDEPLTLAAYSAGTCKKAYVQTTAVGKTLIEMPLFLEPENYINVPLEETYMAAYHGVPRRWKTVLEVDS